MPQKKYMPSGNLRTMLYCIVRLCRDLCTMIGCSLSSHIWVCLKMLCTPFHPMVLLIIIPMKHGYNSLGIYPTFSGPNPYCLFIISRMFPMLGSDNKRCCIVPEALIETAGLGGAGLFLAGSRIRLH